MFDVQRLRRFLNSKNETIVPKGTPISKWEPEQLSKLNVKIMEKGAIQGLGIRLHHPTDQYPVFVEISRMLNLLPFISVADSEAAIRQKLADASRQHRMPELSEFATFLSLSSKLRSRNDNDIGIKYTRANPDPNAKKDEGAEMSEDEDAEMGDGDEDDAGSDESSNTDESKGEDEDEDYMDTDGDDAGSDESNDANEGAEKNGGDANEGEGEDEGEDSMDANEDEMPSTQESMGSSHSASDKRELMLRDTPENISNAVLHEFLSTVTTLYYRKLGCCLVRNLEWTRQEMDLRLDIAGKRHDGKTDGALLLFESKCGKWMKSNNNLWVIVENKRVSTGGRAADTQRCGEMVAAMRARRAANGEPLKDLESQLYLIGLDGEQFVCMSAKFSEKYLSGKDTTAMATVYKLRRVATSSGLRIGTRSGRGKIWAIVFSLVHKLSEELCADFL